MGAAPRLLFLPGAGGDPAFWRPVGDRLPADWDKVYFGWPGLGDQPPDPNVRDFDDLSALVEAQLGDAPVDILAQSMGGAIAIVLALRHPARVRRLVLSVTSAGVDMRAFGAADWRATYLRQHPHAAPWIADAGLDHGPDLHRVTQPTLLLWGDADPISPVAVGEHLRTHLPNAELCVIEGGDHDLVRERAEEIAPLIERYLG